MRAWVAGGAVRFRAEAPSRAAGAGGDRADALRARHRPRPGRVPPPLPPRPADRAGDPAAPWLRPRRRPEPFEALAWAVCEQLIEGRRAAAIERRIVRRLGSRDGRAALPAVRRAAWRGCAPAELDACGLAPKRSIALIRAAREVASGRADLSRHEPSWRRLLAIPNIGNWTIEMLAFEGQGRDDMLPALDLAYVKLVGAAGRPGPARDRGRGARVLRPLRASTPRWPGSTRSIVDTFEA